MVDAKNAQTGDFTVFGFTRDPDFINERLAPQLGITPRTFRIGSLGQFYFYSSYGDVAESEEVLVLKLGFLRSNTKSALNAQQLLEQKIVTPRAIDVDAFSGNGMVVGISKTDPIFSVFQTLMSVPQLNYATMGNSILCSDVLRCIVTLMSHIEINESILPQHFLFQNVAGSSTYFRDVNRLMSGEYLGWIDGNIEKRVMRSLDVISNEAHFIRDDARALNLLSESFEEIVDDYTKQIYTSGQGLVNQLSGGVDSSLTQFYINLKSDHRPSRSISYVIQVPAFEYEREYAHQAIRLLKTEHTFVSYTPQDYPGLLTRTIDYLAQPINHETTPSFLAIAEFIRAANWPERYFFTGHGADSLFGFSEAMKLKGLEMIRGIPFASTWLRVLGTALTPFTESSHTILKGAEIIASENDPDSIFSRSNSILTYEVDWDIVQRCFGSEAIKEALAFRRNLTNQYSHSNHYLDKVHLLELVTFTYDLAVKNRHLALAHQTEQVFPFFDEDFIRVALSFHPDIRYIKGFRYKHLLRRLLKQKTNAPVARKSKGVSTVNDDMVQWMRTGPLKPLVEDIQRPSFLDKADFEHMVKESNYFLFSLLTYDIFKKRVIENYHLNNSDLKRVN